MTTSEPTTSEPTTSEPTTSEPTTSEPTTSEPIEKATPELQAPDAAGAKVAHGALLIDVRSAAGRASAGEIPGATLADRNNLDALFGPSDNPAITLDTPVVIVCGSVDGSGPVAEALAARGYTDVSHVDGGFPAWKQAGLPATEAAEPSAAP
ncbi:rhodanese-like domain-containing protein [Promicromonospora sp. NPDC050880]|uniref:rhodanese-like domain-containing protein n=1 Tax=Promicromonospora sp. NPDC050880 TaxID=3364406 RepID=UPI003788B22E